jgi:hypothetical protein
LTGGAADGGPLLDGGRDDAGGDGGLLDAGDLDAGLIDAGLIDAGDLDAGGDGGLQDAGVLELELEPSLNRDEHGYDAAPAVLSVRSNLMPEANGDKVQIRFFGGGETYRQVSELIIDRLQSSAP